MSATAFSGGRALNNKKYKILPNGRRIYFLYRPGVSIPFIANAPASEEELVPKYSKNFNKNIVVKKEHHFSHLLRQPIMKNPKNKIPVKNEFLLTSEDILSKKFFTSI